MSEKNDGGPAFPFSHDDHDGHGNTLCDGMSLRDYFAAQSIHPMIQQSRGDDGAWDPVAVAVGCYVLADAMIEARKQ